MDRREQYRRQFEEQAEEVGLDLYYINLNNEAEMESVFDNLNIGNDAIKRSNLRSIVDAEQKKKRSRTENESMELRALRAEKELYRLAALRTKSTTERVLATSDDVLSAAYDQAKVCPFWLPDAPKNAKWDAPWADYTVTDPTRTEKTTIQPAFSDKFIPKFPSTSPYVLVDTHSSWNRLTQDATLFMRGKAQVELTAAAIFELVGQDETGFPSKKHKSKFLRDCMRLYLRCGSDREVHGVITDLSRVVAVKLMGLDDNALPIVSKTADFAGDKVPAILAAFAFAAPHLLSVANKQIAFPGDGGTASRPGPPEMIECGKCLGHGLHGRVYTVAGQDYLYVKNFASAEECKQEANMLRTLERNRVPNIPSLAKVSQDKRSLLASPIGKPSYHWQGQGSVWMIGRRLLDSLETMHANGIIHRDIRPSNIIVCLQLNPVLIDWASAAETQTATAYVGTTHYAAQDALSKLENIEVPMPSPEHDLESLVYSIYDLSRPSTSPPLATSIQRNAFQQETDYFAAVRTAWEEEARQKPNILPSLLRSARARDYSALKIAFESKS